jgi:probable phosphoglycerate mutase
MRHGDVQYFEPDGRPLPPNDVVLTEEGCEQARAAGKALESIRFNRVITSGLPRTVETARLTLAAAGVDCHIEEWPDLREIQSGRLRDLPEDQLREAFLSTDFGHISESTRFVGGESIGSLLDRVESAMDRLLADSAWDIVLMVLHGGVNRAILSRALLGERGYLGGIEQAPGCINILDTGGNGDPLRKRTPDQRPRGRTHWIVRAVNISPLNPAHLGARTTTMERLFEQYRPAGKEAK